MAAEERFVFGDRVLWHSCTGFGGGRRGGGALLDSRQKHKARRSHQLIRSHDKCHLTT